MRIISRNGRSLFVHAGKGMSVVDGVISNTLMIALENMQTAHTT